MSPCRWPLDSSPVHLGEKVKAQMIAQSNLDHQKETLISLRTAPLINTILRNVWMHITYNKINLLQGLHF